ncbi:MAG: beta-lactamase family protein [Bacteroidota bacterium]|nr:beta-lactamase family protein [Bacteroidota bacterium]
MYKSTFIFLIFLFFLQNICGQNKQDKQLAKQLDQLISEKYKSIAPGCVVLVAKKGKVIYNKAFGSANIELNVSMRPEMIFRLGSVTKQYTSVAILQLVEQGKISLQDSIQKYVQDHPHKGHTITIENLLTHTSGIEEYQAIKDTMPNGERKDYTPKQGVDFFKNEPLEFEPGTQFKYSNSNYFLLGYIIELITGKSYREYLEQNIFKPTGLTNTYYNQQEKIIPDRVAGYTRLHLSLENADYLSMTAAYAAGALMANTEDLFKWHKALYNGKLIEKKLLDKAVTPFKLKNGNPTGYGYGWYLNEISGSKTIEHAGAIDGFRSDEIYLPAEDIFVAALFNCLEYKNNWMELSNDIATLSMGKPLQPGMKLSDAVLKKYVGTYKFMDDPKINVSLKIYEKDGKLFCDLSNGTGADMVMVPQSETKFILPDVRRITTTIEFIITDEKVTKAVWTQESKNEFVKVE